MNNNIIYEIGQIWESFTSCGERELFIITDIVQKNSSDFDDYELNEKILIKFFMLKRAFEEEPAMATSSMTDMLYDKKHRKERLLTL